MRLLARPRQTKRPVAVGRARWFIAEESRDENEETELAFHKVWLARQLRSMPKPRRRPLVLPAIAGVDVSHDIDGLRSACGLNPLPHRRSA